MPDCRPGSAHSVAPQGQDPPGASGVPAQPHLGDSGRSAAPLLPMHRGAREGDPAELVGGVRGQPRIPERRRPGPDVGVLHGPGHGGSGSQLFTEAQSLGQAYVICSNDRRCGCSACQARDALTLIRGNVRCRSTGGPSGDIQLSAWTPSSRRYPRRRRIRCAAARSVGATRRSMSPETRLTVANMARVEAPLSTIGRTPPASMDRTSSAVSRSLRRER